MHTKGLRSWNADRFVIVTSFLTGLFFRLWFLFLCRAGFRVFLNRIAALVFRMLFHDNVYGYRREYYANFTWHRIWGASSLKNTLLNPLKS